MKKEKEIRENTKNDIFYEVKYRLNENNNFFNNFETNKQYKYDQAKLIQAIKNGMILLINYVAEEDKWKGGRERTIAPLVLGINKNTKNTLVRAYHLEGYSNRVGENVEKVWRLFNVKNIKSMTFTGNYIQMAPKNYRLNDRIMTEKTIVQADFNEIRRNQNNLIQKGFIELEEETKMSKNFMKIKVRETGSHIDLVNPWNNDVLGGKQKEADKIKLTILKSGNEWICVLGALGTIGNSVILYEQVKFLKIFKKWEDSKKGTFQVMDSFRASEFNKHRHVRGITQMPIYIYKGKK